MNRKRMSSILLGVALVLGMASQGQAIPYQWDIDGTFRDGGKLKGTLTINSGAPNPVTAYNLTTSGGSWGGVGVTYRPGFAQSQIINNPNTSRFRINFIIASSTLTLSGYSPNLTQPGPYAISNVSERQRIFFKKFKRGGDAVATPEPGTILLLGSGLAGLGLWRLRKNSKA